MVRFEGRMVRSRGRMVKTRGRMVKARGRMVRWLGRMVRASCRFARDVGAESEARGQEFRLKSGGDLLSEMPDLQVACVYLDPAGHGHLGSVASLTAAEFRRPSGSAGGGRTALGHAQRPFKARRQELSPRFPGRANRGSRAQPRTPPVSRQRSDSGRKMGAFRSEGLELSPGKPAADDIVDIMTSVVLGSYS